MISKYCHRYRGVPCSIATFIPNYHPYQCVLRPDFNKSSIATVADCNSLLQKIK